MSSPGRRIAFVARSVDERASDIAWIEHLQSAGHEVGVIALDPAGSETSSSGAVVHGAHATERPAAVAAVRRVLAETPYDTVIALRTGTNLVTAEALAEPESRHGARLLLVEDVPLSLQAQHGGAAQRRRARQARTWYRRADLVLSSSHPVAAEMTAAFGIPASRSLVVPAPVLAAPADLSAYRVDTGADGIRLLLVGDLAAERGPLIALRAAGVLAARGVDVDVQALHTGPLEREVGELAASLGIAFHRPGVAVEPAGRRAVAVLSAVYDGQGAALIEAAAAGIPGVAISTALGVADAVVPGVTGQLALDDDPTSVADAIVRAAALPVIDADAWLDRFRPAAGGALLLAAIDYAHDLPAT